MYRILNDTEVISQDPWGNCISTMNADSAFDALLRILSEYGCIPGWACLADSHRRFMNGESIRINGIVLEHVR